MGEALPYTLELYVTRTGRVPFDDWLLRLRDAQARARIRVRLARVRLGNLGDAHAVGGGVWELRIDYGPGYRVYYAQNGPAVLLLLGGGDKSTQDADIRQAQRSWAEYQQRRQHEPPDQRLS
jgi:putative addiction module killer protein